MTMEDRMIQQEKAAYERFLKLLDIIITCVLVTISIIGITHAFYCIIFKNSLLICIRSFFEVWACCAFTSAWIYR